MNFSLVVKAWRVLVQQGPGAFALRSTELLLRSLRSKLQRNELQSTKLSSLIDEIGAVKARRELRGSQNIVIPHPTNVNFSGITLAAIVHCYYVEVLPEILDFLGNLPCEYKLFISTDTEDKKAAIESILASHAALHFEVRLVENRGRDIAPKFVTFKDVYENYEFFVHLHTKKSLHAAGEYESWRHYLLNTLMGSRAIASSNLELLQTPGVGVVFPEHVSFVRNVLNWGYDFPIARDLLKRVGVQLTAGHDLEFPSGSMYFGRSQAFSKLLGVGLELSEFPEEAGQVDGTLAHAVERTILFFIETAGYTWVRVTTEGIPAEKEESWAQSSAAKSFVPLLSSALTAYNISLLTYPELQPIRCMPSSSSIIRLNLLVPTLQASQVYGGISTALSVFNQIGKSLPEGSHLRIISTDSNFSAPLTRGLDDFQQARIGQSTNASRVLLDASDRGTHRLDVRREDIFVATAWWTAQQALEVKAYQKSVFDYAPKVIYLIQDFEPGFYGWSTRYALAEETYRRQSDIVAVINSEELATFMEAEYSMRDGFVLPYEGNSELLIEPSGKTRERLIIAYARPGVARNCYELIADGLRLWQLSFPELSETWKVILVGEGSPSDDVHLRNTVNSGKLSLAEYRELLGRAAVGVSLMISPHPSYPPMEMAAAGVQTVVNSFGRRDPALRSSNFIVTPSLSPHGIAASIAVAVERAESAGLMLTPDPIRVPSQGLSSAVFNPAEVFDLAITS